MYTNVGMPMDSILVNDNITPDDQKHNPIKDYEGDRRGPNPQVFGNDLLCFVMINNPTPIRARVGSVVYVVSKNCVGYADDESCEYPDA
jgi:hypothetical protein